MGIFISHASKDAELVQAFVDLLIGTLKVKPESIFCTSLDGFRIPSGEDWRQSIKKNIEAAELAFMIITDNYKNSEVCLVELGAVWIAEVRAIPLIVPPVSPEQAGVMLSTLQIERLDVGASLERVMEIILEIYPNKIKADYWQSQKQRFIQLVQHREMAVQLTEAEKAQQEISEYLARAGFNDFIVDSGLTHSPTLNNIELNNQLVADLRTRDATIDLKFNYLGSLCASNWLKLSKNPSYGHSKLIDLVKSKLNEICEALRLDPSQNIDFISLGPGDGEIDIYILYHLQQTCGKTTYYPIDLSFDLLQTATNNVIKTDWRDARWLDALRIKAIHGDFTQLINYKAIYGYDGNLNFFSLLGFTFGDFNEGQLIGKIKEGMNRGDYLLMDARVHRLNLNGRVQPDQRAALLTNYNNETNNRFAFGPLEAVTVADFNSMEFEFDVKKETTVIPGAINIITYCNNINTRFRADGKVFRKNRLNLSSSTIYSFRELEAWLLEKGFDIIWTHEANATALFLLRRAI